MAYSSFIKTRQIEIASGVSLFEGPEKERSERPEFMRPGPLSVAFLKNAFFSHFFAIFICLPKVKNTGWAWVPTPSWTAPGPHSKNQFSMCFLRKDIKTGNTTFSEFRNDFAVLEGRARALIHKPKTNILGFFQEGS